MKKTLIALLTIGLFSCNPVQTMAFPINNGDSYWPSHFFTDGLFYGSTLEEQLKINNDADRATWEYIRDNGGCWGNWITLDIATYCNQAFFGGPQIGSID